MFASPNVVPGVKSVVNEEKLNWNEKSVENCVALEEYLGWQAVEAPLFLL